MDGVATDRLAELVGRGGVCVLLRLVSHIGGACSRTKLTISSVAWEN
jgi:hypothetical protein